MNTLLVFLMGLALLHGAIIAFSPYARSWPRTVRFYRLSVVLSTAVPVLCFVIWLVACLSWDARDILGGSGDESSITRSLYKYASDYPYISGTVIVSFAVALVITVAELIWVNPFRLASKRPAAVWYLWFLTTISGSILVTALGGKVISPSPNIKMPKSDGKEVTLSGMYNNRYFEIAIAKIDDALEKAKQNNPKPATQEKSDTGEKTDAAASNGVQRNEVRVTTITVYEKASHAFKQSAKAIEVFNRRSNGYPDISRNASDSVKKLVKKVRDSAKAVKDAAAAVTDVEAKKVADDASRVAFAVADLLQSTTNGRYWFGGAALMVIGLLYYIWTTSILYRRLTERDCLVGNTALSVAFAPKPVWSAKIPAQSIVIGPRHSGKTEWLKCINHLKYPSEDNEYTKSTQWPVMARLAGRDNDVSIIDVGGEYLKDQLDLIGSLRTDCLVVVICASYFTNNDQELKHEENWDLKHIHKIIERDYVVGNNHEIGEVAANFFRALYFATNCCMAQKKDEKDNEKDIEKDNEKDDKKDDIRIKRSKAKVQRVLVVLNNRDNYIDTTNAPAFDKIPDYGLERLASSISMRFTCPENTTTYAAVKVALTTPSTSPEKDEAPERGQKQKGRTRNCIAKVQSSCLFDSAGRFIDWPETLAGAWMKPADQTEADSHDATNTTCANAGEDAADDSY